MFVVVTQTIFSFQNFVPVYVMTKGGPMDSTKVIVFYIYQLNPYISNILYFISTLLLIISTIIYIKEHSELYSDRIKEIIKSFVFETTEDLFDTWEDANKHVLKPEIVEKYIGGQLGTNELLLHRVLLFNEFEEMCNLMFTSVVETLRQKTLLTNAIEDYLLDLKRFTIMRKKDALINYETVSNATFKHDFEAIQKAEYRIDPNSFPALEKPLKYQFFHDKEQQKHISDQVKLYSAHAIGLGKLFQRADLRPMFRRFAMTPMSAEQS